MVYSYEKFQIVVLFVGFLRIWKPIQNLQIFYTKQFIMSLESHLLIIDTQLYCINVSKIKRDYEFLRLRKATLAQCAHSFYAIDLFPRMIILK